MEYNSPEFKNSSFAEDEIADFVGSQVVIVVTGGKPIAGRFVSLSEKFVTLEHRDGRHTRIRRRDISIVSQIAVREAV